MKETMLEEALLGVTTRIPKEKTVHSICDFYWTMGHKKIRLIRLSDDKKTYEDYDPAKGIEMAGEIQGIAVLTNKSHKNNLKFGSVQITLQGSSFDTKIMWDVDIRLSAWHVVGVVYLIFALIVPTFYAYYNICPTNYIWRRYCSAIIGGVICGVSFKLMYDSFERNVEKLKSHPDTQKYKTEFEEFMKKEEKEYSRSLSE